MSGNACTDKTAIHRIRQIALSKIEKNMTHFMILNDEIRNPLSVISAVIDLGLDNKDLLIIEQIQLINSIIDRVDSSFLESSKVREFLQKHENFA